MWLDLAEVNKEEWLTVQVLMENDGTAKFEIVYLAHSYYDSLSGFFYTWGLKNQKGA